MEIYLAKIIEFCSKFSIKARINFKTIATALVVLIVTSSFYSFTINKLLFEQKHALLQNVMSNAYGVVQWYGEQAKSGKMTTAEAQLEAMSILKEIRFLKEKNKAPRGYYFIHDFNGTYIMHPIRPDLVGKNKINLEDKNGFKVIYNLAKIAKSPKGEGFVTFYWDKPGIDKKITFPKMGYVKGYKPWGWAIGTGDYIDDIDKQVKVILLLSLLPCLASVLLVILIINATVGQSIIKPIEELTKVSKRLALNDFTLNLKDDDTNTEIGELNRSFKQFAMYFKQKAEHEEFISSILNTTMNGIIILDKTGVIISCNPAGVKLFNSNEEEIAGVNISKFIPKLNIKDLINNSLDNSTEVHKNTDNRYEVATRNNIGSTLFLEFTFNVLKLEEKEVFMIVVRDITHQTEVAKMKNEFISMVSHELRTPLTSIRGSLGLVTSGVLGVLPSKVSELIEMADKNCIRLINLINDILDLDKIKAGKIDFIFGEYEIMPLVEEAIALNKDYAQQYNVKYNLENFADSVFIKTDKDRLLQVITNLLSNAAKFSHPNETVDICITKQDNSILIEVKDKGIGIAAKNNHKIFESFSQVDSSDTRKKGGSGLGLQISKAIINQMGGQIGFTSEENKGSTFYIKMPFIS